MVPERAVGGREHGPVALGLPGTVTLRPVVDGLLGRALTQRRVVLPLGDPLGAVGRPRGDVHVGVDVGEDVDGCVDVPRLVGNAVDDDVGVDLQAGPPEVGLVLAVALDAGDAVGRLEGVVAGAAVEDRHVVSRTEELLDDVAADEPRAADDERVVGHTRGWSGAAKKGAESAARSYRLL